MFLRLLNVVLEALSTLASRGPTARAHVDLTINCGGVQCCNSWPTSTWLICKPTAAATVVCRFYRKICASGKAPKVAVSCTLSNSVHKARVCSRRSAARAAVSLVNVEQIPQRAVMKGLHWWCASKSSLALLLNPDSTTRRRAVSCSLGCKL